MFYQLPIVTLKSPLYMFRTEFYQKASQRLWSWWLSFLYFKCYPFFLNQSQKSKKFHDVRKSGDVQQTKWYMQKFLFYFEDFAYQASELQPILSINKVIHAEDAFCYRDHMCQVSKLQHMYLINYFHKLLHVINTFCTKDHKTHLVISCYTLLHQAARGRRPHNLNTHPIWTMKCKRWKRYLFLKGEQVTRPTSAYLFR